MQTMMQDGSTAVAMDCQDPTPLSPIPEECFFGPTNWGFGPRYRPRRRPHRGTKAYAVVEYESDGSTTVIKRSISLARARSIMATIASDKASDGRNVRIVRDRGFSDKRGPGRRWGKGVAL